MPGFIEKLLGDANAREIKRLESIVEEINGKENEVSKLTLEELRSQSRELKEKILGGADSREILPDAFALIRETARRTLGQRHFDAQLMGGIALFEGKITEMKTGEGKTLTATAPAYLHALAGKGVHIVTVNDYLAKRDAVWMGQIYDALGLSVGCLAHEAAYIYDPEWKSESVETKLDKERDSTGSFKVVTEFLRPVTRAEAYRTDIIYGTNHEFGFDYLRDHLVYRREDLVQRERYYVIIDEVDSILIDEARTPLIISAPDEDAAKLYREFTRLIPRLKEDVDYNVDEKLRSVVLTDEGMENVSKLLGRDIYREDNVVLIHHLEEALKAHILFQRDKDYIVKDNEVIIVDQFTGRLMHGRRFNGGLHQALEAKERVEIKKESRIFAKITLQNYFRMYEKIAGMTGTAATSAEEFHKVYNLEVLQIPTAKSMIREDRADLIYQTERGKFQAIIREIRERHKMGQPILVGTVSIEKNEYLDALLRREGIPHETLNAKNHEREGMIIAQAGRSGAVTIATNMAGRGVDIILGGNPSSPEEAARVKELGGLHVVGTERHEARRIDNQLRGRAGRQGDPGSSQFFVSLEDDLMRIFGSERIKNLMGRFGIPEDEPIQNKMVSRALDSAQAKIEGFNFDVRKHVLEYDDVLSKQRETLYRKRQEILFYDNESVEKLMRDTIKKAVENLIAFHRQENGFNAEELFEVVKTFLPSANISIRENIDRLAVADASAEMPIQLAEYLVSLFEKILDEQKKIAPEGVYEAWKMLALRLLDMLWITHLEAMENLSDSVRLRAYGQRDPLVEYKNEGFRLFRQLLMDFESQLFQWSLRMQITQNVPPKK